MSYTTLSAILKGKWLIEPISAKSYLPMVANVLKGTTEFEEKEPELIIGIHAGSKTKTVRSIGALGWIDKETIAPGSTIVIPVQGALMKNDQFCGPVGMMNLAALVNELGTIENVGTLIFDIDSPGGQVDGTQTLAEAIKNSKKKTIAIVNDGMACSAAYWVGSSCDEFYVSKKTDVVGSIGVYCTFADFKAYYESQGLPIHEVYSRKSSEKNKDYKEAMEGDYAAMQDDLDFLATEFIAAVKANRPGINLSKGDPFKGATYYAQQAIEIGLIDGIKSINEILSNTNMTEKNAEASAEAQEVVETVETDTVEAVEVNTEMVANFIGAMDTEGETALNAALVASKKVIVSADDFAELKQLREWKNETGASHTQGKDKVDTFNDNPDEDAELAALKAKEASVLMNDFGIES